jgi:hypothetical protein
LCRPARRFHALRALADRAGRADRSARRPHRFRFPAEVHRSTTAPSRGTLRLPRVGRCFLPWAFLPHDTCGTGDPCPQGVRPCGVPRARFGYLLRDVHPRPLGEPCGPPSVLGLSPSRRSPRVGPIPSRRPLPSCRSPRRFASPLKVRADASGFTALLPTSSSFCRANPCGPARRRCLRGLFPFRAFSPSVLASASCSRPLPPHALGGIDVPVRLRLEVLRNDGVGLSLSGLPALLGFVTLRPSRHRVGARGGRAYEFASRQRALHAPHRRSKPSRHAPTAPLRARPGAAVHR